MATTSVIVACMNKWDSLNAALFPDGTLLPVYLDQAPQVDGTGSQLRPPYATLTDNGQTPTIAGFERTTLEVCEFTIDVYYSNSLANVATAIWAIRLNGGGIGDGLGFDYGELTDFVAPRDSYQVLRGKVQHSLAEYDKDGKPVYKGTIEYKVTVKESP